MSHNWYVSGKRDQNKAKRRDAILDALISELNKKNSADVTNEDIAALAGVSPATVYNLVGTREDLMMAAINRDLDALDRSLAEHAELDPLETAVLTVELAVESMTANSAAFRQIIPIARRVAGPGTLNRDPSSFLVQAMRRAQAAGLIRSEIDASGLGRQIYLSYAGAVSLWSAGRIDDDGFRTASLHGLYTALAAAATEQYQPEFVESFVRLSKELESTAWGRREVPSSSR